MIRERKEMKMIHARSMSQEAPPALRFPQLAALIDYLDSLSGRADLDVLSRLLSEITIRREDIDDVCRFAANGYRRNLISESPWYELLALCWRSGHCTPIHDHRGSSCAFRVVEGVGTEIRFSMTPAGLVCPVATHRMPTGYICAAEDADIHQVANMQGDGHDLVTLHIYSPPIEKMHTYDYVQSAGAENSDRYR
jgi:cysteine dioxygenase